MTLTHSLGQRTGRRCDTVSHTCVTHTHGHGHGHVYYSSCSAAWALQLHVHVHVYMYYVESIVIPVP